MDCLVPHCQSKSCESFLPSGLYLGLKISPVSVYIQDCKLTYHTGRLPLCMQERRGHFRINAALTSGSIAVLLSLDVSRRLACMRRWAKCLTDEFKNIFGKVCGSMVATTISHKLINVTISSQKVDMDECY